MTDAPVATHRRSPLSPAARSLACSASSLACRTAPLTPKLPPRRAFRESGCGRSSAPRRPGSGVRRAGPPEDADRPPDARFASRRGRRRAGRHKSIPLLLKIIDRLDRYSDPLANFSSPELFVERRRRVPRRRKPAGTKPACAGDAISRSGRKLPNAPCRASKCLKTLKTARPSYWLKLAWIRVGATFALARRRSVAVDAGLRRHDAGIASRKADGKVARKWRRKILKRLNPRPEMAWARKPRTRNIWHTGARLTVRAARLCIGLSGLAISPAGTLPARSA